MLEKIAGLPTRIDGIEAVGNVTAADYRAVLLPLLKKRTAKGSRAKLLYCIGSRAEGFDVPRPLDRQLLTLKTFESIAQCAITASKKWLIEAAPFISLSMPFPCRVFDDAQRLRAVEWLEAAPATDLRVTLLSENRLLLVEPQGRKLRADDFIKIREIADPWIDRHGDLSGVVVNAPSFRGWESFHAFVEHMMFVQEHHRKIRRVALVTDSPLLAIIPAIAAHFVAATIRQFPAHELERAIRWAETQSPELIPEQPAP